MKSKKAFTLMELLVVMAVSMIIVSIAVPYIRASYIDASVQGARQRAAVLNQAVERATQIDGLDNPILFSSDVDELEEFLKVRGYIK